MRGAVRRQAWRDLAYLAERADEALLPAVPNVDHGIDRSEAMADLYIKTRREVLRWMKARGRGVMGPPPGGVGVRK